MTQEERKELERIQKEIRLREKARERNAEQHEKLDKLVEQIKDYHNSRGELTELHIHDMTSDEQHMERFATHHSLLTGYYIDLQKLLMEMI